MAANVLLASSMLATVMAARHTTGLEMPVSYVLSAVSDPSAEMAAESRVSSSSDDDGEVGCAVPTLSSMTATRIHFVNSSRRPAAVAGLASVPPASCSTSCCDSVLPSASAAVSLRLNVAQEDSTTAAAMAPVIRDTPRRFTLARLSVVFDDRNLFGGPAIGGPIGNVPLVVVPQIVGLAVLIG